MQQFENILDAQTLALAIVDTLPEPFVVLDHELRVLAASGSFYDLFEDDAKHTHGRPFFELGGGQWDIPALRLLIETIIPKQTSMESFEVEHDFVGLGRRTMLLNARLVRYRDSTRPTILLAFNDITARRVVEREKEQLLDQTGQLLSQQRMLLREMEHRIANSLQIIASILLLKASKVSSEETRHELRDAHQRVMSVAAVQSHLHAVDGIERIDIAAYLTKLTAGLAASMIGPDQRIEVEVDADDGTMRTSQAVSLGMIVTELVINAIKYAFSAEHADPRIIVNFHFEGRDWTLSVSDNGSGRGTFRGKPSGGLGTAIVTALTRQLEAQIEEVSSLDGLRIAVTHLHKSLQLPAAA